MESDSSSLLHKAATTLADYLGKVLPQVHENWWQNGIVNVLSFQQRRRVEQRGNIFPTSSR